MWSKRCIFVIWHVELLIPGEKDIVNMNSASADNKVSLDYI